MTQEDLLARLKKDISFKDKMDTFMLGMVEFKGEVGQSFSDQATALQRQEGRLDDISTAQSLFGERIKANETKLEDVRTNCKETHGIGPDKVGSKDSKKVLKVGPVALEGFGARDIARLIIAAAVCMILLHLFGIKTDLENVRRRIDTVQPLPSMGVTNNP